MTLNVYYYVCSCACNTQCYNDVNTHTFSTTTSGSPSLCYWHRGDGICEEFERRSAPEDCGFFTPEGFSDQWAVQAETMGGLATPDCPLDVILGTPPHAQVLHKFFCMLTIYPLQLMSVILEFPPFYLFTIL